MQANNSEQFLRIPESFLLEFDNTFRDLCHGRNFIFDNGIPVKCVLCPRCRSRKLLNLLKKFLIDDLALLSQALKIGVATLIQCKLGK